METHPPKLIETVIDKLVPPACRENVMGDWDEKYTSTADYILRVASDLPLIVASQIRRTFNLALFFSQATALYIAFSGAALAVRLGLRGHLFDKSGLLPITIVVVVVLVTLVCRDAYINCDELPDYRARRDAAFAIGIGLTCELLLYVFGGYGLVLSFWILVGGSAAGLLMVYMLRRFFHFSRQDSPATAGGPKTSLEEHRKAWRWNLVWLIASLIVIFTLPDFGNKHTNGILDALILSLFVVHLYRGHRDGLAGTAQEFSALSISGDPYINQLKRKRDGLESWAGTIRHTGAVVLMLAIIAFHFVPFVAERIIGQRLPADASGTHVSLSLIGFAALTAFWIFVRSRSLRAARAIQEELDRLKDRDKNK